MIHHRIARLLVLAFALVLGVTPASAQGKPDFFDMKSIMNDPLDGKVLNSETKDGIVVEQIEFTSRIVDGKPERVVGIFAYPKDAKKLPAVFWSMGGMAKANPVFPTIFAKKGYACLAITLPHPIRNSQAAFDAANPETGNFALLARDQLRGITYLSQRPEADPDLMAVAGASYGGVFSTLLAGIDPRLKAGMSFFGAGNHTLGTNLPQFTKMKSLADMAVWNKTVDGAFRHKTRSIPFIWGVAFNDNWFHFPAVAQTYRDAISPEKRIVIMPRWQHGFPENIDNELIGFFDTVLTKTKPPYNNPGPLQLSQKDGAPVFRFEWTGENKVKAAELVVSYGEYMPWYGWLYRACFTFPAKLDGQSASAVLPIPSKNLPLFAWANLTDENDVVTSTLPVILTREDLAPFTADPTLKLNCFIEEDLGKTAEDFYNRSGNVLAGVADTAVKHGGTQSLRVDPLKEDKPMPVFKVPTFQNVPLLAHKFSVWVRAASPTKLTVSLTPIRPAHWDSSLVAELVSKDSRLAPLLPNWKNKPVPIAATADVNTEWQEVKLDIPLPTDPVEGYKLEIKEEGTDKITYWVDTLRMDPVWP